MRLFYLLVMTALLTGTSELISQKRIKTDDEFDKTGFNVMIFYEDHSYSSFFDRESDKIANLDVDIEKIRDMVGSDTITVLNPANWTFDMNKKRYGVHLEYFFDNDNFLYMTVPFETNTLNQQISYKVDFGSVFTQEIIKNDFDELSKNFLSFIAIGGEYCTYNNVLFHSVMGEIRIPGASQDFIPGSEMIKETYTDDDGKEAVRYTPPWPVQTDNETFISDGAFELHLGTSVGLNFRKTAFKTTFKYLHRAEELSDQLFSSAAFYLNSMKEAKLKLGFNYYHSMTDAPETYYFDYTKTPIYDNTFNADVGFQVYIKKLIVDLNMQIPIWGKNSAANSIFTMKIGWHI